MLIAAGFILASTFVDLLLIAVAVVLSIVLHELAHGWVALWNGDPTAKLSGRLTLNPVKHFNPIGFLMLLVCGFGFAKPVPVNPYNFKHRKRGIITVALAGVTLNFLLAFVSSGLMLLMYVFMARFAQNDIAVSICSVFAQFFSLMMTINLSLCFFNLLPLCPLDGFRVVEGFTRYNNPITKFLREYGTYILIALVGLGMVVDLFRMPVYFDVLGMYIITARDAVIKLFMMIWGVG